MVNIECLHKIDSTNNYLKELLKDKKEILPEFLSVYTLEQTSGRGQKGNVWHSEKNKNILFSTILYPKILPEEQFLLNIVTSLSVIDFIAQLFGTKENLNIKWPNDIYYNDKKLGGILIENSIIGSKIENTIIGIGINLNQTNFPANLPNPISMKQIANQEFNLEKSVELLQKSIIKKYLKIEEVENLKQEYYNLLFRLNNFYNYKINNQIIEAKITGFTNQGLLMLEDKEKKFYKLAFKQIEYIL